MIKSTLKQPLAKLVKYWYYLVQNGALQLQTKL